MTMIATIPSISDLNEICFMLIVRLVGQVPPLSLEIRGLNPGEMVFSSAAHPAFLLVHFSHSCLTRRSKEACCNTAFLACSYFAHVPECHVSS